MEKNRLIGNPESEYLQIPSFLSPPVAAYLADIVQTDSTGENILVSLVIFGSAATGGYGEEVSDVDLLLIVHDKTDKESQQRLQNTVSELELKHAVVKPRSQLPGALEQLFDRITAGVRSFFICSRADLLSGEPGRILGIPAIQAKFVDRIVIPSIVGSGITVWGENLLARVPLPPIRRLDLGKSFFGLFNQLLLCAACYPLLPAATGYAMDALKRSVHSCHFCYNLHPAPLAEEVDFFRQRYGASPTLERLLKLRGKYRPSFGFVLGCFPALVKLYWRAMRDNTFPRQVCDC